MKESRIQVNSRTLLWILIVILFFLTIIFMLNKYDRNRKYSQFKKMNETFNQSEYPSRLSQLIKNYHPEDTTDIKKLKECLFHIEKDFDNVDDAELYIVSDAIYHLTGNSFNQNSSSFERFNYVSADLDKIIKYLDTDSTDLKTLYKLENIKGSVTTTIKIDNGYLRLLKYRR